jgi:signal transduction histidine kinase
MLRNLLDNAERHARSTVRAELARDARGRVTLTVANDGPPIPESELENIFLPFRRLDDARSRDTGGAGLGLAIVREIALHHGGRATAVNDDRGANFVVTFPPG